MLTNLGDCGLNNGDSVEGGNDGPINGDPGLDWKVDLGVAFILGIDFCCCNIGDDSISLVSTGVSPTFLVIDGDGVGDEDEAVVDAEVKDVGEVEDKFSDPLLPVLFLLLLLLLLLG